ncbi:hypothetical protein C2E20_6273 [Micractinium conductrix]|uniref:Uncharacterized protein n=1 Tax=Micractinium conductrix TaxID=554055 RepID=A0A2P6V856_9CHLO|nr:hypothetical protein C2E20_6273 [Micractinium conductrix]|eukprot:PSC70266.1 hypothetical protein C2E20_6273 [Micractinium conductrix]
MQLFARLPAGLLRRLRTVLRLAIPTAVAADTARSVVVTYQLAQQRFQEWEEEDQQEVREQVRDLMRRVVRHREAADRDFWPAALRLASSSSAAAAAGGSVTAAQPAGSEASAAEELAAADVWQLMGLARGIAAAGGSPSSSEQQLQEQHAAAPPPQQQASAVAEWAEAEAQQLLRFERGEAAAAQAAAARGVAAGATLVVVTLNDAMAQVAGKLAGLSLPWTALLSRPPPPGVVRVTLGDVVGILGATPPARAAAVGGDKLGRRLLAAVDDVATTARAALPVPQMGVSRKSALRCAVNWHGVRWPEVPATPLERDLSCC